MHYQSVYNGAGTTTGSNQPAQQQGETIASSGTSNGTNPESLAFLNDCRADQQIRRHEQDPLMAAVMQYGSGGCNFNIPQMTNLYNGTAGTDVRSTIHHIGSASVQTQASSNGLQIYPFRVKRNFHH